MVLKNWKLFVACLSGFWLCKMLLGHPEQRMFPAETKKNGGNIWAGPPILNACVVPIYLAVRVVIFVGTCVKVHTAGESYIW